MTKPKVQITNIDRRPRSPVFVIYHLNFEIRNSPGRLS